MNYTQGKWEIAGDDKCFVYALSKQGVNEFSLLVQGGYTDNGERTSVDILTANAHLISVAPMMYEALIHSKAIMGSLKPNPNISQQDIDNCLMEISKAIAKAKGK